MKHRCDGTELATLYWGEWTVTVIDGSGFVRLRIENDTDTVVVAPYLEADRWERFVAELADKMGLR